MTYCVEVNRGGIGEEDCVFHYYFEEEPTREDIEHLLVNEDIGYSNYCEFTYYRVQ